MLFHFFLFFFSVLTFHEVEKTRRRTFFSCFTLFLHERTAHSTSILWTPSPHHGTPGSFSYTSGVALLKGGRETDATVHRHFRPLSPLSSSLATQHFTGCCLQSFLSLPLHLKHLFPLIFTANLIHENTNKLLLSSKAFGLT